MHLLLRFRPQLDAFSNDYNAEMRSDLILRSSISAWKLRERFTHITDILSL